MPTEIVFSGSPSDRLDFRRRDAPWLQERMADESSKFLPVWRLNVLVRTDETRWPGRTPKSASPSPRASSPSSSAWTETWPTSAVDLSNLEDPIEELGLEGAAEFPDLRATASALPAADAAIAAQARHLIDWHSRHRFCPGCGEATRPREAGYVRTCKDCGTDTSPGPTRW